MNTSDFNNLFGDMDLELMDLILKGHFEGRKKILDAGCGEGRNLIYFLNDQFDVKAIDRDQSSVNLTRYVFRELGQLNGQEDVLLGDLHQLHFRDQSFDAIICSRVLHFSESQTSFLTQWNELHRILKVGGLLYCSTDSMIGFESEVINIDQSKWQFKDGSIRFLLNEELLQHLDLQTKYRSLEPIKTILHGNQHAHSILALIKK